MVLVYEPEDNLESHDVENSVEPVDSHRNQMSAEYIVKSVVQLADR